MCNPREITVTATRQIDEAWEHAIAQTVELADRVSGEARVRESLDASLATPVLRALETVLAHPDSGWAPVEGGFRHEIEGGYVVYQIDDRALEIVATASDEVKAVAVARRNLSGHLSGEIKAQGTGNFWHDGFGGRDQAFGTRVANENAERNLGPARQDLIDQTKREAELEASGELTEEARAEAASELRRRSQERIAELETAARRHLDAVGVRARQLFYRALGGAYRDAILAYARGHGANDISCQESGDTLEIEFLVQR